MRRLFGEWSWRRLFKSTAFVYGCLVIVAVFFADRLIFFPPRPTSADPGDPALVMLGEKDGGERIATLWHPPTTADAPVLIWTHGNAEDLGTLAPLLEIFAGTGMGVLGCDYPGYGLSEGQPDEAGCYRAIDAAFRFLTDEKGIPPERIVLVGQSLGGGPALWLAEREPGICGLVLISPFLSAFRVGTRIPIFPRDRFLNLRRMPKITCPLLVFHGERDEVVPFSHGKKLFALHPGPAKAFVPLPEAGHNDLWNYYLDEVLAMVTDFALDLRLPEQEVTQP